MKLFNLFKYGNIVKGTKGFWTLKIAWLFVPTIMKYRPTETTDDIAVCGPQVSISRGAILKQTIQIDVSRLTIPKRIKYFLFQYHFGINEGFSQITFI